MKIVTLLTLLGVAVMLMGCNGTGSGGGSKVKTGCLALVTLMR